MTEYKRMLANLGEIEAINQRLAVTSWVDANLPEAKQLLDKAQDDLVPNTSSRVEKMLAKAREKDPERQIYNEATCIKIEELAVSSEKIFEVTARVAPYVETSYLDDLRRRVASEQYLAQLVDSTATLGSREHDARVMLRLEESQSWRSLSAVKVVDYEQSLARFRAREAAELGREMERRDLERRRFDATAVASQTDGGAALVNALRAADQSGEVRRNLLGLLDLIVSDPSYVGVRKLRNSNATLMQQFGHPGAIASPGTDGVAAATVVRTYTAVEAVLAAVGYRPEYTVADFARPASSGTWSVDWAALPWAKYGERLLVLDEPIPERDPDAWMRWHESLANIVHLLEPGR